MHANGSASLTCSTPRGGGLPDALRAAEPRAKRTIDEARTSAAHRRRAGGCTWTCVRSRRVSALAGPDAAIAGCGLPRRSEPVEHVPDDCTPCARPAEGDVPKLVVVSNATGPSQDVRSRQAIAVLRSDLRSCVEKSRSPTALLPDRARTIRQSRSRTTTHVGDLYHVDVVGARGAGLGQSCSTPRTCMKGRLREGVHAGRVSIKSVRRVRTRER